MTEDFYLSLANEMAAKLRRVSCFIKHGPSIGTYHEEVLRSILTTMLPTRFQLRTGFSYTKAGGASQQGDILIVDENHPGAYHFREGNFAIVSPEALVCVIEVKTRLNTKTFSESLTNLHSFSSASTSRQPKTFLFAYESTPFTPKNLTSWYESVRHIPDEIRNYPFAIYALNQGIIILRKSANADWGHVPIEGESVRGAKLKSLSLFLQTIRKVLLLHSQVTTNPFENAQMDGLRYSQYLCRYGPSSAPFA